MKLTSVLTPDCIKIPLEARSKREAIEELVDLLALRDKLTDPQAVLKAVLDREAARTTGIGKGLAIPHGKSTGTDRLVMAIGKPEPPLDFDSIDGQRVNLVVLLASPLDQTGPHIQALARFSRFMLNKQFRREVQQAKLPQQVYQTLLRQEEQNP